MSHNMVNFGPVTAQIVSLVWGTPVNFNGFCVLAALLHGTAVLVVSWTLRRWTEGATYIRQGGHNVGHWPTFLVLSFFSRLISAATDWMSTILLHSANLEFRSVLHAARWKCRSQKIAKNWPSGHHRTTLSGYIFPTDACINNRKKTCQAYVLHMFPQYGVLRPTNGWDRFRSLGHPCKFHRVRVLAALLHGTLVVGISQTLRHWAEGATYIQKGGHHFGQWPLF